MFGLTLYDFASFISLYVQVKVEKFLLKIKLWASFTEAWSPRVILSFLFFLSLSVLLSGWLLGGTGALWLHFFAWASKTRLGRCPASSPGRRCPASSTHQEGICSLREQSKFHVRSFIGFLCKPRKIKPLSLPFYFPYRQCCHPEGFPGSYWGWTPAESDMTVWLTHTFGTSGTAMCTRGCALLCSRLGTCK